MMKNDGDEKILEEELDQELEALVDFMPEHEELEQNIEQRIRKKVQKIVLKTIAVLAAVLAGLFLIINPCMNAMFLNPVKLNREPDRQMFRTLNSYWETVEPYVEIISFTAEKKGFARYDLEIQATDRRSPLHYGKANIWVSMVCGKYKKWQDPEFLMVHHMGRFEENVYPERTKAEIEEEHKKILEEIRELPPSAQIYLSVSEKNPKNLQELKQEKIDVNWIQVYQPRVQFQGGLSMHKSVLEDEQKIRENLTPEELKEVYISNLEDMIEHEQIWREFGLSDSHYSYPEASVAMQLLKETCEDAKKMEKLETRNYCISGKRDDMVEYLEKTELEHIQVDDVKLSVLKR